MTIYIVQKIDGYSGWGTCYGDVIEVFKTREEAEKYCYEHNLTSAMGGGWPTIAIIKKELECE